MPGTGLAVDPTAKAAACGRGKTPQGVARSGRRMVSQKWRVLALIAIMSMVAIGAVAIAIGMLYDAAVDVERQRLAVSAQREARWLESMMRFELEDLRRDRSEAERASLIQFLDAHRRYRVFGETRETVLARRDDDQIAFLMRHGLGTLEANDRLPFDGERAQPMYRALQGLSGTMIGIDHEGIRVVAAYEPVEVLDLGIVAKVDLAEVRAPFVRAGLLAAAISIGLVAVGAWLFVAISRPMIRDLEEHARHLERLVLALRESEERFRYTFEQSAVGVAHVSPDGAFVRVNSRFCEITGYAAEELTRMRAQQLSHPDDLDAAASNVARAVAGEIDTFNSERRYLRKDGSVIWVDNTVSLVRDEHGQPRYFIAMVADATDRKRAAVAMTALLDEKDVLLREIHHRVKNNLQVVSSLLNLQALKLEDETLRRVFQESQSRIRAMALIHETLYESHDLSRIELGPYISRVGDSLIGMYGASADRIRLRVEAERVALTIDDMVPCGLIINELLSNSLKHAFPDGRAGEVRIAATASPKGIVTLELRDNGVGLPADLDIHDTTTMGMRLVTGLVENQLGGTIEVDRRTGTAFRVSFHPGTRSAGRSA